MGRKPKFKLRHYREMAAVDERARALLERTEALSPEEINKPHGTLRSLRPIESQAESDAPLGRLWIPSHYLRMFR